MKKTLIDFDLLKKLMEAYGVSSHEKGIREMIKKEITSCVDDVKVDKMGNLIAHKKGKGPKVMLAAHMDEIGLMVKEIDNNGFIKVAAIGGIDASTVLGERVHIQCGKNVIRGLITTAEISAAEYVEELPGIDELFVDTGLKKQELLDMGVEVGTYLELERETIMYGKKISGKALDDRIGCFILVKVAQAIKNMDQEVFFVFTVQEEVGLHGAKTSAYEIEPDMGIAVDVTVANDAYDDATVRLGGGPCLTVMDESMIANKSINEALKAAAKRLNIPLQLEVGSFGTTDASIISISKRGVPSTVIAVPVRNMHTTVEIAYSTDVVNALNVLIEFLKKPPKDLLD